MKLRIKTTGILVWLLAVVSAVYAEPKPSDKLIGTWIQSNYACYAEITKDKIVQHKLWNYYNRGECAIHSYVDGGEPGVRNWTDNNDGQTITIHGVELNGVKLNDNMFCPYAVTDKYLYLDCFGGYDRILFVKSEKRNPAKLLGEWVLPQPDMDISVTITHDKVIYKKGKLTEEKKLKLVEENEKKFEDFEDYLFLDDTHVIVGTNHFPLPDNIRIVGHYRVDLVLIKK